MIRMKALRSGNMGAGAVKVRRGREFEVADERRAVELENGGLAYRVETKMAVPVANKMETPPENKAAHAGPLGSVGGETGVEAPAQSSRPVHQPRRRRSPRSEDDFLS